MSRTIWISHTWQELVGWATNDQMCVYKSLRRSKLFG